mmetsp:Transcript_19286/g.74058  ORF Transcript_19286/g.74058 Transcript_19286/m.74058 type:complete len:124 (+) Transcript_19286:41-412(+)
MANSKKTLYVGGLEETVTEELLTAAFVPFGEIVEVQIPRSGGSEAKGFGFVEFEEPDDAAAALDNMHLSELEGRVIKCSIAKPQSAKRRTRAIWEEDEVALEGEAEPSAAAGAEGKKRIIGPV